MEIDWNEYSVFAYEYTKQGKPTIIIELVTNLIKERQKLELKHSEKIASIKGVLNSVYGILAYPNFRIYMREIPERITEIARNTIQALGDIVRKMGYSVVYADTDSLACQVPKEELSTTESRLNDILKKEFGDYSIKLDKYFTRMLFTNAKKKYVGSSEDGELHFTGFERIRSDSSNYTKEIQEMVMRMILTKRESEIIPYLKDKVENIKIVSLEDIAVSKTLSRELDEYTGNQQNYIKELREMKLQVKEGDAVKIVPALNYKYGVCVFQDESDLPRKVEIDYKAVISKQIEAKVDELLPLVNLDFAMVAGLGQQGKLL